MTDVAAQVGAEGASDTDAFVPPMPQIISQALTLRAMQGVELEVDVVIGRARMTLGELLGTRTRTTILLDRALHSPAEVMVNGTLFARGELVAVNDSELGVQITEILSTHIGEASSR